MTAVSVHRPRRRSASSMSANEPEDVLMETLDVREEEERVKIKKKRKKEKRRKRYSSPGDEPLERHLSKKNRSKRKRRGEDDDESSGGRINPIFLWVKENNAKIVAVVCEDYDKRNRIKLTKTANGWISVPHTKNEWSRPGSNNQDPELSSTVSEPEASEHGASGSEHEETLSFTENVLRVTIGEECLDHHTPIKKEAEDDRTELYQNDTENDTSREEVVRVPEHLSEPESTDPNMTTCLSEEPLKDHEVLVSVKPCCNDLTSPINLDENHNNEVNPSAILTDSLAGNPNNELTDHLLGTCVPDVDVDSFCNDDHDCVVKGIIDELESSINSSSDDSYGNSPDSMGKPEPVEFSQHSLMEELEEICHDIMNEELKVDKADDKGGVELFSISDALHQSSTTTPPPSSPHGGCVSPPPRLGSRESPQEISPDLKPTEEALSPKHSPMNLVVDSKVKPKENACLIDNDLETLDILWRLPEGTTIHQSKQEIVLPKCKESASPSPVPPKSFDDKTILAYPVQDEPLNLGKPKEMSNLKIDIRPDKFFFKKDSIPDPIKLPKTRTKNTDLYPEIPVEPLTQLKELMADPDMSVPDPLLVPKARLPALIANPKQEIPRLMALNNEISYSRLEADLLEVSLAHLQLLVQSGSKVDELKTSQKNAQVLQAHNNASCLDPATVNALNQMLWLPYLTQLDVPRQNNAQDLIGMMNMMNYPYNWGHKAFDCLPSQPQPPLLPSWEELLQRPPNFLNSTTFPTTARLYGDGPKNPLANPLLTRNVFSGPVPRSRDSSSRMQSSHRRGRPQQPSLPPPKHATYPSSGVQDFCRIPQTRTHHQPLIPNSIHQPHHSLTTQPVTHGWPSSVPSQRATTVVPSQQPSDIYNRVPPTNGNPASATTTASTWVPGVDSKTMNKPPSSTNKIGETLPKLKVRKFDIDPNSIPKLLNIDRNKYIPPETTTGNNMNLHHHPLYNGNQLWHPLYAGVPPLKSVEHKKIKEKAPVCYRPEEKKQDYVSPWNWTIPVTVSGK